MHNALTIDVEDYFHVSAFESVAPPETWENRPLRVEANTDKILHLLNEKGVQATFFILGWVAERVPGVVRSIANEGHEVASHGYGHRRVYNQERAVFRQDIRRSKALLEDLTGAPVLGYRAPSYSISREVFWAFDELVEAGYLYDSSVFPIKHDLYGLADWPRFPSRARRLENGEWVAEEQTAAGTSPADPPGQGCSLLELPITTLELGKRHIPIAGGGYFRFFPYPFTRWGLRRINAQEGRPFVFYLHPWELDPLQPRMSGAGAKSRFRHYLNLGKTEGRFRRLLQDFAFGPVCQVFPL